MIELKPCPFCGAKEPNVRSLTTVDAAVVICGAPDGCGALACACNTEEEAVEAWNTRASGWIPCSERLPDLFETVLVTYKGYDGELVYSVSERFQFNGQKGIRWSAIAGNTPSHWMPLPEPSEINGGTSCLSSFVE